MKHLQTLLLCCIATGAFAQSWCPPQATWHHSYRDGNAGVVGYVRTEYVGDTMLDGAVNQRLRSTLFGYDQTTSQTFTQEIGERYSYSQGDLVTLEGDTLYWFGASPGDQWSSNSFGNGLTVLDTGTMMISTVPLRFLVVQLVEPTGPAQDTIVERIGYLNYFWDAQNVYLFDLGYEGLRCYTDADIDFTKTGEPSCDYVLSVPNDLATVAVGLFPNPAYRCATLTWPVTDGVTNDGVATIFLFNASGACSSQTTVRAAEGKAVFDVTGLAPGLYTVQLLTERSSAFLSTKLVME